MIHGDINLDGRGLGRSTDYRVLRRLVPRSTYAPSIGRETKTAILLDTETTGLDACRDEIIELGMVKFDYLPDGRIGGVRDTFSGFNEPTVPIPDEITTLTGITDDIVAGHRIDEAAVKAFVDDAVIVIAHNSRFDRKFSERHWPIFERKVWACSATEVDWRLDGFEGLKLGYLLNGAGFFHHVHRVVDDCHALLEILAFELPTTGAGTRAPARDRPQEDDTGLGRAVAVRAQGFPEASRISLVGRKRWKTAVLVCRRRRDGARCRARVSQD